MKTMLLSVKKARLICLIVLLCFLIYLYPNSAEAATKSVNFTNIDQYAELDTYEHFTIRWSASGGTVTAYTFSLRYLYKKMELKNISIYSGESVSVSEASFTIPGDVLSPNGLYRYSVSATIDGKKVWSQERYFYTSSHEPLTSTLNFHIYNGFSSASKEAAYYATQTWANELGYSRASTYPFSMGTDDIGTDNDGKEINSHNGRNVISVGWYDCDDFVAVTKTYRSFGKIVEKDIFLNRNGASFCNSAQNGKYDVQSVFTHELGHVYGLTDKYEIDGYGGWATTWTMFGTGPANSIAYRTLTSYDKAHIHSLYD